MSRPLRVAPLGEVITPVARSETPLPGQVYRQIGVKLWGEGAYEREPMDGARTKYAYLFRAEAGDIIVNKIWARNGSVAVVGEELAGCYGSGEFPMFAPKPDRLDPRWMHWLTKTPGFWAQCDEKSQGTSGKNRIRPERFLEIEVPLPELSEQRRVVARIEELTGRLEKARSLRERAAEETEALIAARAYSVFARFATREPIDSVAEVRSGIQKGPHRLAGANPVRYLTVAHVQRNQIRTDQPRFFEVTPAELERWRLLPGDVLVIEGNGSSEQIGRTALFQGEIPDCVHQNHVIRIRPWQERLIPEFLNAFLNSPAGQEAVRRQSRTTSGLRSLSVGRIKGIPVPLPQLAEQRSALVELREWEAEAETLRHLQSAASAALDALPPAILDRAFRGEL